MKTILITGCSSGIGHCAATTLKKRGWRVFATTRKIEDVNQLKAEGFEAFQLDLNDSASIKTTVVAVLTKTDNKLDALLNNAGYAETGAVEDLTRDALRRQFETNLFGLLELTNLIIPVMRKQGFGRIINISSVLGLVALPFHSGAYQASKFALEGLTDCLRMELYGTDIKISLIEPGPIESKFRENARLAFEHNLNLQQSKHKERYQKWLNRVERNKKESIFTRSPQAVVKKIVQALDRRPKIRYYVTMPTYFLACCKRLLPHSILDWLLRKIS